MEFFGGANPKKESLLGHEKVKAIILAVLLGRKIAFEMGQRADDQATQEELLKAIEWAERVEVDGILLELVVQGNLSMDVREDGEVVFFRGDADETTSADD